MSRPTVGRFEIAGRDGLALHQYYSQTFQRDITDAGDVSSSGLVESGVKSIAAEIGASQDSGEGAVTFYVEIGNPAAALPRAELLGAQTIAAPAALADHGLAFAFFADPDGDGVGPFKGTIS